jgi:hypothetical protein
LTAPDFPFIFNIVFLKVLGHAIRITSGSTADLLHDVLMLLPLDDYAEDKIVVMVAFLLSFEYNII